MFCFSQIKVHIELTFISIQIRFAAEMLARMNDPFYRFFGKMATDDKASLDRDAVVERFKGSAEFRRLAKKLRAEGFLDQDTDEEVLRQSVSKHSLQLD